MLAAAGCCRNLSLAKKQPAQGTVKQVWLEVPIV